MITYLLATTNEFGKGETGETVVRYEPAEMEEIFSAAERDKLARGGKVYKGALTYVDMVVAARNA